MCVMPILSSGEKQELWRTSWDEYLQTKIESGLQWYDRNQFSSREGETIPVVCHRLGDIKFTFSGWNHSIQINHVGMTGYYFFKMHIWASFQSWTF